VPSPLDVEVRPVASGTIRVLTMRRPQARNAMDSGLLVALVDALDEAERDPDLRGLLLTGAGGTFSAGADVREELPDGGRRRMELFTTFYEQLSLLPLPTAAAIEGHAVGGGAEAAAACDLRAAGRSAILRFPGAIHGIPVGTARTIGQVGLGVARDWVLSSRDVGAPEAHAAGFVQRVVDDGQAVAAALAWLEQVASRDRDTVALLKRWFNEHGGVRDRVAFENDALRVQAESGRLPGATDDLPRTVRPRRR
jgi:enoyl-CoA hydratase/carnithine racemase